MIISHFERLLQLGARLLILSPFPHDDAGLPQLSSVPFLHRKDLRGYGEASWSASPANVDRALTPRFEFLRSSSLFLMGNAKIQWSSH